MIMHILGSDELELLELQSASADDDLLDFLQQYYIPAEMDPPPAPNPIDAEEEELCQILQDVLVTPPRSRSQSAVSAADASNAVSSSELESRVSTILIRDANKRGRSISLEQLVCPPGDAKKHKEDACCSSIKPALSSKLPLLSGNASQRMSGVIDRQRSLTSDDTFDSRCEKESARLLNDELKVVMTERSLASEVKNAIAMLLQRRDESKHIVRELWDLRAKYEAILDELLQHRQQVIDDLRSYSLRIPSFADADDGQMPVLLVHAKQQTFLLGSFRREISTLSSEFLVAKKGRSRNLGKPPAPHTPPMGNLGRPKRDPEDLAREHGRGGENTGTNPGTGTSTGESSIARAKTSRRRLPIAAVEAMKGWIYSNVDNPWPSRETRRGFGDRFRLTQKQVDDWFVNTRARHLGKKQKFIS